MTAELLLRGAAFGFVIAAAVGPISLLCIRRTLADGARVGLASGLGVATADATYGAIAAFGISAISDILVGERRILALAGGLALVYLGVRTALSRPGATATGDNRRGLIGAYTSILGLTLTNPMTILSFAGLVAGLGLSGGGGTGAALLVAGVFSGSAAWWLLLTTVTSRLRSLVTPRGLGRLNVGSGALVVCFGLVALWTGVAQPA